jgi:MFS family permease
MLLFPSLSLWIYQDLEIGLPETLHLGFPMYLLFGLTALPMGFLGDRWSNRKMLISMMLGMGTASMICAMATKPWHLMAGLSLIGLFASIYHPVGIGMISKTCAQRGRALGNNGVWGNLGIGLAPLLAGLAAHLIGWRSGFVIYGAIAIILGLLITRLEIDETPLSGKTSSGSEKEKGNSLLPYFIMVLCCMTLLGFCYRGTVVSIPAYFRENIQSLSSLFSFNENFQVKDAQSFGTTLLVSGIYLFGIFGQMTGGRLADKLDLRYAYLMFHALSLPCMILMGLLTEIPLFLVSMVYIFFALGMQPIENSLVARLTPNHLRSLAYGMKFVMVLGMGSFSVKIVKWIMNNKEINLV